MQRTSEAIAVSQSALEIGRAMLALLESETEIYEICISGLGVLRKWTQGLTTVADCRRAAFKVHEMARLCTDSLQKNAIRSIGHAIATAHVSSHLEACQKYAAKASNSSS